MRIDYQFFELDNGLRVFVHEDADVPKAAVNIIYRVGAKHESPDRTGFAHLFEHLMFEGSANIPDYDTHVERVGGSNNAFTTNDVTNYYIVLPADQLETAFWLESDRMNELAFSEESLAVQKSVVIEEFKQNYLNQPYGDAYLHLRPLMYQQHPYQWMTIGKNTEQIATATLAEVKDFFYKFYAPNNATLVVAGGVKTEEVRALAEKWFGPIPRRALGHKPLPIEPVQRDARAKTVSAKNLPQTVVFKAWHIPARSAPDYFVAEILAGILTNGKSSRLLNELVKQKKVSSSIGAFSWQLHDTGQFSINAQLVPGVTPEAFELVLAESLQNLGNVTQAEVNRKIEQLYSEELFDRATVSSRALSIAMADVLGDPERVNTELDTLRAITADQVKAFASKYLQPTNCSTLYYQPE